LSGVVVAYSNQCGWSQFESEKEKRFMSNPLLEHSEFPKFSSIRPEHVKSAIKQRIQDCYEVIERVSQEQDVTWEKCILPLEIKDNLLMESWSPVSHLNSVANSTRLRAVYEDCLPLMSEYSTFAGQHQGLYRVFTQIKESDDFENLTQAQKTFLKNTLRNFKLSGVALADYEKKRYAEICQRLSELGNQFSNNVMDSTQAWRKHVTDASVLAGLPESAFKVAEEEAHKSNLEGWVLTLHMPCYISVMTYADNQALRQEVYTAFVTRASDQGPHDGSHDNSAIIEETLSLRHELAQLLQFENYAQKSLATKMADSCEQVTQFLRQLAQQSKPQAEKELHALKLFAKEHDGREHLEPWDLTYYSEKQKQYLFEVSEEELRAYFPEERVLIGMFKTVKKLFNIHIQERKGVDRWHRDVKYFEVFDEFDDLKGGFYLDLYARANKRGGAWMDVCRDRMKVGNQIQYPVAYLTCNFMPPNKNQVARLTHQDVVTLFHEFGHTLHHILTEVDVIGVAGINGVAWDAVELPSQFLENWCYQPESLSEISSHFETKAPLPQAILDRLLDGKNFQSAMSMLRQLEFSLFDFGLHQEYHPDKANFAKAHLAEVRRDVAVVYPPDFHRFENSFNHIFAGGYAAGYYSYKWAEVLSADAFAKFEEEGVFNPQTGQSFLKNILQKGGTLPAMALFRSFRGREPKIQPLLRHSGIEAANTQQLLKP
jgi:oligopeptidase A